MPDKRPYISFAEVKAKVPIPDVLEPLGIADTFTQKGDTYTGICPLPTHQHGPQPNPQQFKINQKGDTWLWHCFADCNRGGDVIELVKAVKELSDQHVRFWFAEHFGDRLSTTKDKQKQNDQPKTADKPVKPLKPLRFYLNLDADAARPYLNDRGVSDETIERYGLGLAHKGVLKDYVAMPICGYPRSDQENPLAYIGRWPGEDFDEANDRPRYKIPAGFETGRVVYGLPEAMDSLAARNVPLIVVEGPFKVYHLIQCGYPNTVSTLTANVSDEQADILSRTNLPVVLFFDGNEAGYAGMRRAAGRLITNTFVRVIKLAEGTEPDHLMPDKLDHLLAFAKPSS